MNINYVNLAGNIGNIDVKKTKNDKEFIVITLATNKTISDKEGKKTQVTQWHTVTVYGAKKVEHAKKLVKGDNIVIYGELAYSSWETEDKKHHKSAYILVKTFNKIESLTDKVETDEADVADDDEIPF
jgi:single-strand DNA-binding protein